MKTKYLIYISIILLLFSSCSRIIPMNPEYYKAPTKVGVLVISHDIDMARTGSQGLLDYAITPGNRFIEGLETVEDDVEPTEDITTMYQKIFEGNGKEYVLIEPEDPFREGIPRSGKSGKKYSQYNFAELKSTYGIDEVLFVRVNHGLLVSYYGFIELEKTGYCNILSEIINIDDSSVSYRNVNLKTSKMQGKWNGGENYAYLRAAIWKAVEIAIKEERRAMAGTPQS